MERKLTKQQRADVDRLTKPRPFEPDPAKHDALVKEAQAALERLHQAGISVSDYTRSSHVR